MHASILSSNHHNLCRRPHSLLLRYIEKKILKLDAVKASDAVQEAKAVAKNPTTIQHLNEAEKRLDSLKANLNGSFAKTRIIALLLLFTAATATAQRIETVIQTPIHSDTIPVSFNYYNDSGSTRYLAQAMISIQGYFDTCDSGYQVTATQPVITDTAAHTAVPAHVLFSQNKLRYTFYFQQNHRLACAGGTVTEIAKDTIIVPHSHSTCSFNVVFSNPQINNFFSISTSPGTNTILFQDWWRFFITQP